jgi:hypothetical protein
MIVVPADKPVTTPELMPTGPIDVFALLQVPPVRELLKVVVNPSHTVSVPDIAAGSEFTDTTAKAGQPLVFVYVILAVPSATPVTSPVEALTIATLRLPLPHVPPVIEFDSVVADPAHIDIVPVTEATGFTVSTLVRTHPAAVV